MNEFLQSELWLTILLPLLTVIGRILLVSVPLMICMAMLTYMERKVIGFMQLRKGPNVTGPFGLLQPFADGLKLFLKETIIPTKSNRVMFLLAPMITFALALLGWAVIPFSEEFVIANLNVGILYLFAISSLGVYGIIISGWASNSKYAFLGAIRSSAQMVSYEVSIGLVIITVLLFVGSLNMGDIVRAQAGGMGHWFAFNIFSGQFPLFPMFVVFFISGLAETNRLPFDLPEAEGELVAGYNVEYSSMAFALFFLGEYMNMMLIGAMTSILFLGGWYAPFEALSFIPGPIWLIGKIILCMFVFLWVRATFPRYRYDQLMRLGWKIFLPLSLLWVVMTSGWLVYTHQLPQIPGKTVAVETISAPKAFGAVWMKKDHTIYLMHTTVENGKTNEGLDVIPLKDERYKEAYKQFKPLKPGESKAFDINANGEMVFKPIEKKHE